MICRKVKAIAPRHFDLEPAAGPPDLSDRAGRELVPSNAGVQQGSRESDLRSGCNCWKRRCTR
jgi:hypothetical protein